MKGITITILSILVVASNAAAAKSTSGRGSDTVMVGSWHAITERIKRTTIVEFLMLGSVISKLYIYQIILGIINVLFTGE